MASKTIFSEEEQGLLGEMAKSRTVPGNSEDEPEAALQA